MIARDVVMGKEAREALVAGVNKLANAVRCTLGPKGRTVILAPSTGRQVITKDGVSVAKHIQLADPKEQVGAQLIRDVASQACDAAGDGTTTATVLAQAIINKGIELAAAGIDPINLKRGLDLATDAVLRELRTLATPADTHESIYNVAAISANGDTVIAKQIADALCAVTENGVVIINESRELEDKLDFVTGLTYDTGYLSNAFINSTAAGAWQINGPVAIAVVANDLEDATLTVAILQSIPGVPAILLAPSFSEDVTAVLQHAVTRNGIDVCPVRMPGFGSRMNDNIRDICAFTGAKPILDKSSIDWGTANNAVVKRKTFTIGADMTVDPAYLAELEERAASESGNMKVFTEDRIARLKGQIATITVGGNSEVSMKERKDRYDDAVNAARAAMRSGVLPGGGVALYNVAKALAERANTLDGAMQYGFKLLLEACSTPIRQIAANAGVSGDVVLNEIGRVDIPGWGWNAATDVYGDMYTMAVIDPAEVTISAITYATSVAGLILTTDCVITDIL